MSPSTLKLSCHDVVIALMGTTGAGKSNFIDKARNHWDSAGLGLEPHSEGIQVVQIPHPSIPAPGKLVLLDTPSFDDGKTSDIEVLELISNWMAKAYKDKIDLAGILYMHRITDNRVSGTPKRNLHIFQKLTGDAALGKVTLVTTMWDNLKNDAVGVPREDELKQRFWSSMIERGADTTRFRNTNQCAREIIDRIIDVYKLDHALLIQTELVDLGKQLKETAAGRELYTDLQKQLYEQDETLKQLTQVAKERDNPVLKKALDAQLEIVEGDLKKTLDQIKKLKVPIFKRIWNWIRF